jgi:hypothetical protein
MRMIPFSMHLGILPMMYNSLEAIELITSPSYAQTVYKM